MVNAKNYINNLDRRLIGLIARVLLHLMVQMGLCLDLFLKLVKLVWFLNLVI